VAEPVAVDQPGGWTEVIEPAAPVQGEIAGTYRPPPEPTAELAAVEPGTSEPYTIADAAAAIEPGTTEPVDRVDAQPRGTADTENSGA
jgi:hypothetical protein